MRQLLSRIHQGVLAVAQWRRAGASRLEALQLVRRGAVPIAGGVSAGFINDLKNDLLYPSGAQSLVPQSQSAGTVNGAAIDLDGSDGPCFAFLAIGALTGTIDVKVQESDTSGGTYADIPGAAFPQQTAASKTLILNFRRSKRFCRLVSVVGTGPVLVSGGLFGQKKYQ